MIPPPTRIARRLLDGASEAAVTTLHALGLGRGLPLPPRGLRDVGPSDFQATGREFLRYFVEIGSLESHERVLEIGCGPGRMARPLTGYLSPEGSYVGLDVVRRSIGWCRRNISRRHPNFVFHDMDVANRRYNPTGSVSAAEYVFPLPDGSFDLVFLTSVFTHMYPEDTWHYLGEVARLLAPAGRLLCTFFLCNAEQEELAARGLNQIDFHHFGSGYRTRDASIPESAIALPEAEVRARIAAAGLQLREPIRFGTWSGRPDGLSFQDLVLAVAPAGGRA